VRPPRRSRTGTRRDDGVKVIRTNEVNFGGHEHPLIERTSEDAEYREWKRGDRRLAPARDTGLAVEGRIARHRRQQERAQRRNLVLAACVAVALLVALGGWRWASDRRAAANPVGETTATAGVGAIPIASSRSFTSKAIATMRSSNKPKPAPPTPIFANYKKLQLHVPVPVARLTEIGFHQASYAYALPMDSPMPDAKLSSAANKVGTSRDTSAQPTGADAVLVGSVLRMWRPRPGKPDTAADVGGRPGTVVIAPVSGTVVKIKAYKLYGKWDDYEIHIRPEGYPKLDLVMVHVNDLTITVGDEVEAGVTPIAHIRKLSDKVSHQLRDYVKGGGGDHVHVQINDATDPAYKGLQGAIKMASDPATGTAAGTTSKTAGTATPSP